MYRIHTPVPQRSLFPAHTPPRLLRVAVALVALSLLAFACGDTELTGPRCGDGTVASGSRCVPELTCGEGTEQINELCVDPDSASCGEGTVESDGECRPAPEPTCGDGTDLVDSSCIADPGPVCGSGTAEVGGECVVSDELSCGSGTERVGDECLPMVACGPGTTLVEAECVSDRALGNSVFTVCAAVAADFCGEIQSCCGARPFDGSGLTIPNLLGYEPTCEVLLEVGCFTLVVGRQARSVALGEAEPVVDPLAVLGPAFAVDECTVSVPQFQGIFENAAEAVLVTPLQEFQEPCSGNFACTSDLTCVEDVEDAAACRNPGSAGIACDAGDDADCQDGFYCRTADGDSVCVPFATLHPANNDCSSRLCNPEIAYCDAGTCMALVDLGGDCQLDAACGADAYCRDGTCSVYRQVSESCDDALDRCGPDLVCSEGTCADRVSVCDWFEEEGA